ncbi:MAG: gliding motility-associated C-terminal domain-containing protein, partial [Bacteroidales bacterium]|nr:gliding motility-associated C-terminal domain-containing protein [Bacteroidales bacterium]
GTLDYGTTETLTLTATVNIGIGGTTLTNIVSNTQDQFDTNITPDDNSEDITINNDADIVLTKTVNNNKPNASDDITFTITVTNNGPAQAQNLVITDTIPAGLTFVNAITTAGTWSAPHWTIGTLNKGSTDTLRIVANVNTGTNGTVITNTISNSQEQTDTNITADDDIEIITVNDIPVANDDYETIDEDNILNSNVLTNDTGLNDGGIIVTVTTDVVNGTLALNTDGTYTYTPDANYHGSDSFVYEVCDVDNECDQAAVNITINSVNDLPVAQDDNININEDSELNKILILEDNGNGADDFGGDGPSTSPVKLIVNTEDGVLELNDNGTPNNPTDDYFLYTPEHNYYGHDSFEYEICDYDGDCDQAIVNIEVIDDDVLSIPEIFTPNGDGINDLFYVEGLELYPDNSILIFNRWGDKVFEASPYNSDWDGTSNFGIVPGGKQLTEGTYFYIIKLKNKHKDIKGYIYLKR